MAVAMLPPTGLSPWVGERVRSHRPVVELRDYQQESLVHVAHATADGKRRLVVVLPTGAGKTVVFGALAYAWLSDSMGRVLVLAHRDELISQAAAKMAMWIPRHLIGIVKAGKNEVDAPVVVASVQTLRNDARLAQAGEFGLIVVDEAHHASAASYKKILGELGAFGDDGPIVVGVTATPKRGDGVQIDDVFEHVAYAKTYTEMVARGYLAPVSAKAFDLIAHAGRPKLGIDGDYAEGWLEGVMLGANAPDKIVEAWREHAYDRPTIVFTPTVSVAKAVSEAFNEAGTSAAWVSGAMPITDRRSALAGLASGKIRVIANCAVLTEGFDEPSVSCIVVGRPTKNEQLYIQMVGRGTRCLGQNIADSIAAGKRDCLILDMVGCTDQLQLDAVVELGGRRASASRSDADPSERGDGDVPFQTTDGTLVARTATPVKSVCRWVNLGDGWYALNLMNEGWLTVQPDDEGTYDVVHRPRRGRFENKYDGLSLDWAKSIGEGIAKDLGAFGAMRGRAAWLDRPISDKQYAWATTDGYPITRETTSWEFTVLQAERKALGWRR